MRSFKLAVLLTVFTLIIVGGFSQSISAQSMSVGTIVPADHPHTIALERFKEIVEENTDILVEIYPDSQLGRALTQMENVQMGTQEAFVDGLGWYGEYVGAYYAPATAFLLTGYDHWDNVSESELGESFRQELLDEYGIRMLDDTWMRPPRQTIANVKIENAEDVEGISMRVPSLLSYTIPWETLGASTTPIEIGEVYMGLSQGVVDGMEIPIDFIYTHGVYEVTDYFNETEHQYETAGLIINEDFFQSLTEEEREVVQEAAIEAGVYNDEVAEEFMVEIREEIKDDIEFVEVDRDSFFEALSDMPYKLEEEGLWEEGLYDKIMEYAPEN